MLAVREHGRGKRLGTCLVLELREFAACVYEYAGCAHLNMLVAHVLNMLVAHGHGRGTCLGMYLV